MKTSRFNNIGVARSVLAAGSALLLGVGLCAGLAKAQGSKGASGDEQEVRRTVATYGSGEGQRTPERIGALWTNDAVYVSETGERVQGREAIVKRLLDYQKSHPGDRIRLTVESVRMLGDGVAQVEGNAEVRGPDGPPDVSPYLAVLVKREGRWLLDNVRDLSPPAEDSDQPASERLKALEWMVGDWKQSGGGTTVELSCRWDKSHNFLLWDYTMTAAGKEVMTVSQRVGWDPLLGQFRSWVFDSVGGFAEGKWEKDEGSWAIVQSGVLPDGGTASATAMLTPVDKNAFDWRLTQRRVGGERLPDVNVRFSRSGTQVGKK